MQSKAETAKQWLVMEIAMTLLVLSQVISLVSGVGQTVMHVGFAIGATGLGIGADSMRRRTNRMDS